MLLHTKAISRRSASHRAFTLTDILVSLVIVAILIALMLPAIGMVRESTRKVICASNLRQVGLGLSLYSEDQRERLPDSIFLPPAPRGQGASYGAFERMDTVWLPTEEFPELGDNRWDGLGILFGHEYINAPSIYYCPSHQGAFTYAEHQNDWANLKQADEIIVNYLYRGSGPNGSRVLYNIEPTAALVSDTLRSYYDLNHKGGFNVLQAGLAVDWYEDIGGQIASDILFRGGDDDDRSSTIRNAWGRLDDLPGASD